MSVRPVKHSVTLRGHRTSISLEAPFWQELRAIARDRNMPINALVVEVDETRDMESGLASALRIYVLETLKSRIPRPD